MVLRDGSLDVETARVVADGIPLGLTFDTDFVVLMGELSEDVVRGVGAREVEGADRSRSRVEVLETIEGSTERRVAGDLNHFDAEFPLGQMELSGRINGDDVRAMREVNVHVLSSVGSADGRGTGSPVHLEIIRASASGNSG